MLAMPGNIIVPLFQTPASGTNLAPTGAPVAATAGAGATGAPVSYGIGGYRQMDWTIVLEGDAVSGLVGRLWLYHGELRVPSDAGTQRHIWAPAGVGTDADKGKINGGAAIGTVTHNERFEGLGPCDGFHLQILAGTITNLRGWLIGAVRGR